MEDATFRLNMVYTLAAGTAQRPFAAAPVAVCNRRMQDRVQIIKILRKKKEKKRKSQHIFAKKIKKFQTQAAKAVEKTASADRKPRISRG